MHAAVWSPFCNCLCIWMSVSIRKRLNIGSPWRQSFQGDAVCCWERSPSLEVKLGFQRLYESALNPWHWHNGEVAFWDTVQQSNGDLIADVREASLVGARLLSSSVLLSAGAAGADPPHLHPIRSDHPDLHLRPSGPLPSPQWWREERSLPRFRRETTRIYMINF